MVRNPPANAGDTGDVHLIRVRKKPWRRKWKHNPVFLPGKSHGQRSLVAYSPWGLKRVRHDLVTKQQQQHSLYTTNATVCLSLHLLMDIWVVFLLSGYCEKSDYELPCKSLCLDMSFRFSWVNAKDRMTGSYDRCMLRSVRNCQSAFHSGCTFYRPTSST